MKREMTDERKNVQTTPTRTYCKPSRPLPYYNPNCRTPRHPLWETARYSRLKYCLKGPVNPNQPTNQPNPRGVEVSWEKFKGWSAGAMVLGKLLVPGRPAIWPIVGQGPIALAVGADGSCLGNFTYKLTLSGP